MTLDQLLTSLVTLLTRSGSNRVSAADILTACQNIVNFFASQIASIIPDWSDAVTFNTDGSGAGKYCKFPDATGKKRLYETLADGNINHAPPASGGSNAYWQEISASPSASIPEWEAGVFGPGLVIVFHNHSTDGRGLYALIDPSRPFNSTNIETELAADKWERLGGSGEGGASTFAELGGSASDNSSLVSYVAAQLAALVNAAPSTLDTLNELAAALGDDPNFATTITTLIGGKVSKAGDSMSGNLAMGGNKVTGVATPSAAGEVLTYAQDLSAVALTDVASIAITGPKHTLSSSESEIAWSYTFTGEEMKVLITLSLTDAEYTFPSGTLCVFEGDASGSNVMDLFGVPGDKYLLVITKFGSSYVAVCKNIGQ